MNTTVKIILSASIVFLYALRYKVDDPNTLTLVMCILLAGWIANGKE